MGLVIHKDDIPFIEGKRVDLSVMLSFGMLLGHFNGL
jgi:hypothetical protein